MEQELSFGFNEIDSVYREQKKEGIIKELPPNFYINLERYLKELREEYYKAYNLDVTHGHITHGQLSAKTSMLHDEYIKANQRISQIYEFRVRMMVLNALAKDSGGGVKSITNQLTQREKEFIEKQNQLLKQHRANMIPLYPPLESMEKLEGDYLNMRVHRDVYWPFVKAVEELHGGKRKDYIGPTAEEALKEKTEELLAEIEARNGKR